MPQIIVPIKGMHCRSCELLLEDKISKIAGVSKVRTNYKKGQAEVNFNGEERVEDIIKAVELSVNTEANVGLAVVFVVGLVAGVSTCMGMYRGVIRAQ